MTDCQYSATELWDMLREQISTLAAEEPVLRDFLHGTVLNHTCFGSALAGLLAEKLACGSLPAGMLLPVFKELHISTLQSSL